MLTMLIGPEIVEARAFIDVVISKEGITILICNDVDSCLESLQAYFDGDDYYNYTIVDNEIHLTIR